MPAAYRAWAESEEPEIWGVIPWCGIVATGGRRVPAAGYQTSPAYPASWPDLERSYDGVPVADQSAGGVDQVGAALHRRDQLVVEQPTRFGVQRRVDRDHVHGRDHLLHRLVVSHVQLPLDVLGQPVLVGVVQPYVERGEAAQHRQPDPTSRDGADVHALKVIGALDAVGDVPPDRPARSDDEGR